MKIKEIKEEEILFDNGYVLKYYHDQDCCEHVYADFDMIKQYNVSTVTGMTINIYDIDFNEDLGSLVKGIEDAGFNMISKIGENFFIPCYNEQNGCYNDCLELILVKGKITEHLDISEYVKDDIW